MAHHGGGGSGGKKKSEDSMPYVIGSSVSGILEVLIFHPIDTIAKRLMSNTTTIFQTGAPQAENWGRLNQVLFKKDVNKGFFGKWLSLFPGVSFGAVYKILQRTYKFGSQPLLTPIITDHYGGWFDQTFGKNSKDMQNAVSGALVGMGEVVLLPLDVLKIKSQTNPDVLKGRGLVELFVKENIRLYRGTTWTMARNAPGSFALFGANSLVYTRLFGVKGPRDAKGYQIFVGSMAGGIASIIVSSPLDVIKTRLQNKAFDDKRSGFRVVAELVKDEGFHAFFKGLTPKIGLIGPKLVFSFTVAQWLTKEIQIYLEKAEGAVKTTGGHKTPLEKAENAVKSIKDKAEKDVKEAKDKVEKEVKEVKDKVEKEIKDVKGKVEKEIKDIKDKADGHK